MSEVMINPDQVDKKANEIETLAKTMKAKVEEVHTLAVSLKEVWQDEAQEEFETSFTKLSNSFEEFISAIPGYAAQAHNHADIMRRTGKNA